MNKPLKYSCPKCGCKTYSAREIRTKGNLLSTILNFDNRRFTSVTCSECKYTELYNIPYKKLREVLDVMTNI